MSYAKTGTGSAKMRRHAQLKEVDSDDFLASLTLLATYRRKQSDGKIAVSCKRKDVLKLTLSEYKALADQIEKGMIDSAKLLARKRSSITRRCLT